MEDSKTLDHQDEIPDINNNKEKIEIKSRESDSITNIDNELNNKDTKINLMENSNDKSNTKMDNNKKLEDNEKKELAPNSSTNKDLTNNNTDKSTKENIKEKNTDVKNLSIAEPNLDKPSSNAAEKIDNVKKELEKRTNLEENKKVNMEGKSNTNVDKNNTKEISTTTPVKAKSKPVKEPPIEKKPFLEFVNDYLIPAIKNEFKLKGKEVNKIILQKTNRPIAEDICWVIYCEINDTCNFWLSFEKDDITSLKSFSLCKNYEKPSIIESFLIDEKKITLKLIISRILQRLNGQKLIGAN